MLTSSSEYPSVSVKPSNASPTAGNPPRGVITTNSFAEPFASVLSEASLSAFFVPSTFGMCWALTVLRMVPQI